MGPHPRKALRAQAAVTSPARVRAELDGQAAASRALLVPGGWGAGAGDTLRRVIGTERKMGMEMRIGLGESGAHPPSRLTAPLASLGLPALLGEARATRAQTLALLDLVLAAPPWHVGRGRAAGGTGTERTGPCRRERQQKSALFGR